MSDRNPSISNAGQPATPQATVWLSVEQIRKMQRMRRERVIEAMDSGILPFEQRGRVRYARLRDVKAWEDLRLNRSSIKSVTARTIRPELRDLL